MNPYSPQDAEADFAVAVKVGVEADSVVSSGDELDPWWVDGVVRGTTEQEEKEATLVWCVERPCDQGMDLQEMTVWQLSHLPDNWENSICWQKHWDAVEST